MLQLSVSHVIMLLYVIVLRHTGIAFNFPILAVWGLTISEVQAILGGGVLARKNKKPLENVLAKELCGDPTHWILSKWAGPFCPNALEFLIRKQVLHSYVQRLRIANFFAGAFFQHLTFLKHSRLRLWFLRVPYGAGVPVCGQGSCFDGLFLQKRQCYKQHHWSSCGRNFRRASNARQLATSGTCNNPRFHCRLSQKSTKNNEGPFPPFPHLCLKFRAATLQQLWVFSEGQHRLHQPQQRHDLRSSREKRRDHRLRHRLGSWGQWRWSPRCQAFKKKLRQSIILWWWFFQKMFFFLRRCHQSNWLSWYSKYKVRLGI